MTTNKYQSNSNAQIFIGVNYDDDTIYVLLIDISENKVNIASNIRFNDPTIFDNINIEEKSDIWENYIQKEKDNLVDFISLLIVKTIEDYADRNVIVHAPTKSTIRSIVEEIYSQSYICE